MHTLIHQCATAVQCPGPSPARIAIILWWTVPFHPRVHEQEPAQSAFLNEVPQAANILFEAILKNYSELYSTFLTFGDECVGAFGADVNWLFDQNMESLLGGCNTLGSVRARGTSNNDQLQTR